MKFLYKAKVNPHQTIDGEVEADNLDSAVKKIIKLGFTPLDVREENEENKVRKNKFPQLPQISFKRIPSAELNLFTRQVSDLVDAAVPILNALNITANQVQNVHLKEVVMQIHDDVRDGSSFSNALAKHGKVFSKLYMSMVKAGEVSGQLSTVLNRLADFSEKDEETRSKVFLSLAYPAFVFLIGCLTIFVLLSFVIPRMTVIFEDFGRSLPAATLVLLSLSNFFVRFWWVIVLIVGGGVFYFNKFIAAENGRIWFDKLKLKTPVIGKYILDVEVGRFARTLGTLVESGVSIVIALDSVWAVLDNKVLAEEVKRMSSDVANGMSLNKSLRASLFFPEVAVNMITVGEESGRLAQGLYKIANTYERNAEQKVKLMVSLLGPIVLLIVVAVIGFVVIAMLLPILQMNLIIQ